jgi:hypothetical protein
MLIIVSRSLYADVDSVPGYPESSIALKAALIDEVRKFIVLYVLRSASSAIAMSIDAVC